MGLAWTYLLDYDAQWVDTGPEALDRAYAETQLAKENGAPGYHIQRLLGQVSAGRGDYAQALEHNSRAIELNPNDGDLLATQAILLRNDGRYDEARKWIEDAIRRNPHHPDWYGSVLAATYHHNKNYDQAVAVLGRSQSLAIWDHLILAASYAQMGKVEKARQHAGEVLAINPGFSLSQFEKKNKLRRKADREHYLDGLTKAGLPQ